MPALDHSTLINVATWEGAIQVPSDYGSAPTITLVLVANNAVAGKAARIRVSSAVVPVGSSEDTAYTDEAYVNVSVPSAANQRFDQAYSLSTAVAAGATLNVKVSRDANNGADTLTSVSVLIWRCTFGYTAA